MDLWLLCEGIHTAGKSFSSASRSSGALDLDPCQELMQAWSECQIHMWVLYCRARCQQWIQGEAADDVAVGGIAHSWLECDVWLARVLRSEVCIFPPWLDDASAAAVTAP